MRALTRRWWLDGRAALGMMLLPAIALVFASCGVFDAPRPLPESAPVASNLLANAGFESDASSWVAPMLAGSDGFSISDSVSRSGSHSLALQLAGNAEATGSHTVGGVQAINTKEFPEYISGFYRVDDWHSAATFQYVQAVVAVRSDDYGDGVPVHEIRFSLAGLDRPPFSVPGVSFFFLSRAAPAGHNWVYFDYPLRLAFMTRFGKVPSRWDAIDVRLEVRYDAKTKDEGATSAQVYFDDLYVGPQASNPNRPPDP